MRARKERAGQTQASVKAAEVAVLDADPAVDALLHEYDLARAWLECLAEAIRVIGPLRLPRRFQHWDATNRPLPPFSPLAPRWKEALARLEAGEVDAALPAID